MSRMICLCLLVLLYVISACSRVSQPPLSASRATGEASSQSVCPSDRVIIRFGVHEGELPVYQPLVAAFNAEASDMCVRLIPFGNNSLPGAGITQEVIATVRQADVVELFRHQLNAQTEGLFLDLHPLLEADAAFDKADYFPNALEFIGPDQQLYMLPRVLAPQVIAYNQDLWNARGLPTPDATWTWDDVLNAAEQLTTRVGGTTTVYGLSDINYGLTTALFHLDSQGVELATLPMEDIDMTRPPYIAAVERVAALADAGVLYLDQRDQEDLLHKIRTGRIAMWWGWSDMITEQLQQEEDLPFAVGVIPFPQFDSYIRNNRSGYLINRATQHPNHAWRWLTFLSKQSIPPIDGRWDSTEYPTRHSLVAQSGVMNNQPPMMQTALAAMAERPRQPVPGGRDTYGQLTVLIQTLEQVVIADVAVPRALREAQATFTQQVAAMQRTPTVVVEPVPVNTPVAQTAPPGATSIVFAAGNFDQIRLRTLVDQFHDANPTVFVQIIHNDITMSSSELARQSDCFVGYGQVPADAAQHFLDLQPLLDADATVSRDDYLPGLLTDQSESKLYGLPYEIVLRTLVYQPQLFNQADLPYPEADWTFQDLMHAAQQLSASDGTRYGFASRFPLQHLDYVLSQSGASLTQSQGANIQPNFTAPDTIYALEQYVDLLRHFGPALPQEEPADRNPVDNAIMGGHVAIWFDYSNSIVPLKHRYPFPIALAAPPFTERAPGVHDVKISRWLAISAHTSSQEACWRWIQHLSGDPVFISGDWPARASVAASEVFQQHATAGASDVYHAYRQALTRLPAADPLVVAETPIDNYWFNQAMDRALHGAEVAQVLQEAQTTTLQHLNCVRTGGDPDECARQVDPDYTDNRQQPSGTD
ncbi:MAG: extracellular solute-binding protein [Chloroflexaceae bacterium]